MSTVTAPLREMSLQQWLAEPGGPEGYRDELVRGHRIMTPTPMPAHLLAESRLIRLLGRFLPAGWEPLGGCSVQVHDHPPTVRIPDVAIVRVPFRGSWVFASTDVVLAVEVVSPSSVETDWITKRAEYAAAGIPNYLIVDVCEDPVVYLFDTLLPAADDQPRRYADPTGDGSTVTLTIADRPLTISATDVR